MDYDFRKISFDHVKHLMNMCYDIVITYTTIKQRDLTLEVANEGNLTNDDRSTILYSHS